MALKAYNQVSKNLNNLNAACSAHYCFHYMIYINNLIARLLGISIIQCHFHYAKTHMAERVNCLLSPEPYEADYLVLDF